MINKLKLRDQNQELEMDEDATVEQETEENNTISSQFSDETINYTINELNTQKKQIQRHESVFEELRKTKE